MRQGIEQRKDGAFVLHGFPLAEKYQAIIAQEQRAILVSPQCWIEPRITLGGKQIINLLTAVRVGGFELLDGRNQFRRNLLRGIRAAARKALLGDEKSHRNRDEHQISQAAAALRAAAHSDLHQHLVTAEAVALSPSPLYSGER